MLKGAEVEEGAVTFEMEKVFQQATYKASLNPEFPCDKP